MAKMPNGRMKEFDRGCWTSMAPDNSHRMWVFDVDHRQVKLYDKKGKRLAWIDLHGGPGVKGWEIYHPRWSNNVRFVTVTGPYSNNRSRACRTPKDLANLIGKGGFNVELYIGPFASSACRKIDAWVRVTNNKKADFYGDAWIEPKKETRRL